jgi:pyrroloquinoline-quinone synthase
MGASTQVAKVQTDLLDPQKALTILATCRQLEVQRFQAHKNECNRFRQTVACHGSGGAFIVGSLKEGDFMTGQQLFQELDARIAKFDLLCHPFYKAWSAGELTREDLREYALDYYQHVNAFPSYLAAFALRLDEGELRRAVLANMQDEQGGETLSGETLEAHSDLWMDFAEGMGAGRNAFGHKAVREVNDLVAHFSRVAEEGTPEEALAAFYAYESQVPRVAAEKDRGLRASYGADEHTTRYFTLHATADIYHANVWREQLGKRVASNPESAEKALTAAENAAKALWVALDGIESRRMAKAA